MNKCVYAFFLLIIVMLVSLTGCVGSVGLPPDSNMASVPSSSNTEKHSEPTSTGTESSNTEKHSEPTSTGTESSNTEKHSEPTSTGTESSTDDILSVSIEAVEDQVAKAGSYCQYINDENGIFLVISPNAVIRSFRFVTVQVDDTELGLIYSISDELYSIDELTQDKPFLVKMQFVGLLPTYGIVFEDQKNNERFYTINMRGIDHTEGQPYYLNEVIPSKSP